jgi:hypothetical protein
MEPVSFASDRITIVPHTATDADDIGKAIPLRVFAGARPVSVYKLGNGDLLFRLIDGQFIEGPELETEVV